MFKVFFKELFNLVKCNTLTKETLKCLLFYLFTSLTGSLIKDLEAQEEFYELCSEIYSQDGLF